MQSVGITGRTRLLGVMADAIGQARSPGLANPVLQEQKLWGAVVLVPLHVSSDGLRDYDIAINGISLGMKPDDELPILLEVIEASSLIAECVIAPEMTRLLEIAKSKGRAIHTEGPMLAGQMNLMLRFMGAQNEGDSL